MKNTIKTMLLVILLTACAPAAPAAPPLPAQPALNPAIAQVVDVRSVQLLDAPSGTRLYNPEAISLVMINRSLGIPIAEAVYAEAVKQGLPVETIARINNLDYILVQGSRTGLEPRIDSGFIVAYNEKTGNFIKLAPNLSGRQNALVIGHNGVNAMLNELWRQYGQVLPDGFPRQASNLFWAEFPGGGRYLAYETGNFGFTLQHEILRGMITPEQATPVWRAKFLLEVEVCASTGFCASDPNGRNSTVVRLKNGQMVSMSFDLEARGSSQTTVTPERIEKIARMNRAHAEKFGITLDTTIPEELRLKYPVLSQFAQARTGFTMFGVPINGKHVNIWGHMPTGTLVAEDVQAVSGRVREMLKSGQLKMTSESVTLSEITTNRGIVRDVTLVRSDYAAESAFRNTLLKGLFMDTAYLMAGFTLVDWIDTGGLRGVEVHVLSLASNATITTSAGNNNLDDLMNNVAATKYRWQMKEVDDMRAVAGFGKYPLPFDYEVIQWLNWETGYSSIEEFVAAMDNAGVPWEVTRQALINMIANTTYPFQVYGFVANGRMPLDLRVSSFVNDYDELTMVFWGSSVFSDGELSPIASYMRTPSGWVLVGSMDEPIYLSLSELYGDWYYQSMCTLYPPADAYLFSCIDVTPR